MPEMSYADLMDKLITERDELIRENERLRLQIEEMKKAASETPEK